MSSIQRHYIKWIFGIRACSIHSTHRPNIAVFPRMVYRVGGGRGGEAAREKQLITHKGAFIILPADFSTETMQKGLAQNIQCDKSRDLQPRLLYLAKLSSRIEGQIKSFPRQEKAKGFHYHQTSITRNVKGLL